jgi:NAD(P)-dependent dehydrogenase (short-subunit alcohol dehydrogenase family)
MTQASNTSQNKVALITGGSRGLGRASALALAGTGVAVIVTYQQQADAARAVVKEIEAQGGKAASLQLDVGDSTQFSDFVGKVSTLLATHFGCNRFDYLFNNAGAGLHAPLASTSESDFDTLVRVHLKAPLFLTQALLPLINDGGRILNVSTGLTRFAVPGYGAYAAMKGAVEVLSRYWAKELGERGITVNTLAPGAIETDFGNGAVRDNPQIKGYLASVTALARVGVPDDIGPAVAALLSDSHRWLNAQRVEFSGGMFV